MTIPISQKGPLETMRSWIAGRAVRAGLYAVIALVLVASVVILGNEIKRHIGEFDLFIQRLGPLAYVVFIPLCAILSSFFVPDLIFGIIAGASFGFTRGVVAVAAGTIGGAVLQYALGRRLLKKPIDGMLSRRPALLSMVDAVRRQELKLQFLVRLTPINRAMTSYILGAAGVRLSRFLLACFALVPSICLEVYAGSAGKHLAGLAGRSSHSMAIHDVVLVTGLVVAIGVMVMVSRIARRALEDATESSDGGRVQA